MTKFPTWVRPKLANISFGSLTWIDINIRFCTLTYKKHQLGLMLLFDKIWDYIMFGKMETEIKKRKMSKGKKRDGKRRKKFLFSCCLVSR